MDKKTITKRTQDFLDSDYEMLYNRLLDEFNVSYLRTYKSQKLAFNHKDYRISYIDVYGFCLWWNFDAFSFIEYLVVDKNYRKQGVGSSLLKAIKDFKRPIILEIESDSSKMKFYQKNGFQECFLITTPCRLTKLHN